MYADRNLYVSRNLPQEQNYTETCLVKTGHSVVREGDVTNWSSVFRVLLELTVAALVPPATHREMKASRLMSK